MNIKEEEKNLILNEIRLLFQQNDGNKITPVLATGFLSALEFILFSQKNIEENKE